MRPKGERGTLHRRALQVLRRRYRDPDLLLADVASELGCSARQLQRVLREQGNQDFRGALLEIRMEKARALLSRDVNPLPTRQVAVLVGYRNPSGLRQAFRRYWGLNPSDVQPRHAEFLGELDEAELRKQVQY